MRQTLGTKITGATARYYLPFRLPSDVYFSEIHVKTTYDPFGSSYSYATFIRLFVYENENDYVEVGGNPAGNPLMLFSGWVRNGEESDYVRIPINYIIDLYNYSRFVITADYTGTVGGELSIEILYSDVISNTPNFYDSKKHAGLLHYTGTLNGHAGAGVETLQFAFGDGETFTLQDLRLKNSGGTDITTYYQIYDLGKPRTHQTNNGDRIFLDPADRGELLIGGLTLIYIYTLGLTAGESMTVDITGFPSSAQLPTTTLTGAGSLTSEAFLIY